jgi:hypothetical protein
MNPQNLKIAAIKRKYRDQWVLLADYRLNERNEPLEGIVVAHSKDRNKIYDALRDHPESLCIYYAGQVPQKGVAYAL